MKFEQSISKQQHKLKSYEVLEGILWCLTGV